MVPTGSAREGGGTDTRDSALPSTGCLDATGSRSGLDPRPGGPHVPGTGLFKCRGTLESTHVVTNVLSLFHRPTPTVSPPLTGNPPEGPCPSPQRLNILSVRGTSSAVRRLRESCLAQEGTYRRAVPARMFQFPRPPDFPCPDDLHHLLPTSFSLNV